MVKKLGVIICLSNKNNTSATCSQIQNIF